MVSEKINLKSECVGCGTCEKECPGGAISIIADRKGFRTPQIDVDKCITCNRCEQVCPQINYSPTGCENPKCYGVIANEEVLNQSSSGGAFSVICDYIFEREGYVCGAAYNSDFKSVSHIMISSKDELYKLRGSKYVRSDLGNIFNVVREKLDGGNYVLFSGTPCQVVALYNVLGKDYEKLITVDLICSGVPSEHFFAQYVDEIRKDKVIKSINMRPKKYGWDASGIQIIFEDNSEYMIPGIRDPYLKAYLNKIMNYSACYNCQFASWPRQADFTIGDLWHVQKLFFKENFEKGISCLTTNSVKAEKIFAEIKGKYADVRSVQLEFLKTHNMTIKKRRVPLCRERFFSLLNEKMSFDDAVDYAINWKFDVAITGCWTVPNYGGLLTYYALYNLIKSFGMKIIMVERRANIPNYNVPKSINVRQQLYPYYDVSRIHKSFEEQKELNERVCSFVSGSDQIWNYRLLDDDTISSYMFDYVAPYRKKIAYAASFGSEKFNGNDDQKEKYQRLIRNFDYVSTREENGKKILKEFAVEADTVLDPVLVCHKEVYDFLAQRAVVRIPQKTFVFTYFVTPDKSKEGFEKIVDELRLGMVNAITCDNFHLKKYGLLEKWKYPYEANLKLEDWLFYIKNCSCLITDSFHGVCLALVYHKNFIFIKGKLSNESGLDRVTSLLNIVGLENHIVDDVDGALNFINNNEFNIDFNLVEELLAPYKWTSIKWLKQALSEKK